MILEKNLKEIASNLNHSAFISVNVGNIPHEFHPYHGGEVVLVALQCSPFVRLARNKRSFVICSEGQRWNEKQY
jgi:hypothetical protein